MTRFVAFLGVLVLVACGSGSSASGSSHRTPRKRTAKELGQIVKRAIAAEKWALKSFDHNKAGTRQDLEQSLSELRSAAASSALNPDFASATSDLKQAIHGDEIALENLSNKHEQDRARAKINIAIVRKESAEAVYARAADHEPVVSPITANFVSEQSETVYTITASDPDGDRLLRDWKLTPPAADPTCNDFTFDSSTPNEAIWHHGNDNGCDHSKEGPRGHLGTVTVAVSDEHWTCTASYFGTISGTGDPATCKPRS